MAKMAKMAKMPSHGHNAAVLTDRNSPRDSNHPSEGARFLLKRLQRSADDQHALYDAAVYTPTSRFDYRAEMHLDGELTLTAQSEPAPQDLEAKLTTIAKLVARSAKSRRDDDLPPWPDRVLRWRGPGRG